MKVAVWIDNALPSPSQVAWEEVFRDSGTVRLYDESDPRVSVLLHIASDYQQSTVAAEPQLTARTRLLRLSSAIPEPWVNRIRGYFPPRTPVEVVPPI